MAQAPEGMYATIIWNHLIIYYDVIIKKKEEEEEKKLLLCGYI